MSTIQQSDAGGIQKTDFNNPFRGDHLPKLNWSEENRQVSAAVSAMRRDKLLIATGARPMTPPISGLEHGGVHACWTLADAREIASRTGKGKAVVLIGRPVDSPESLHTRSRRRNKWGGQVT